MRQKKTDPKEVNVLVIDLDNRDIISEAIFWQGDKIHSLSAGRDRWVGGGHEDVCIASDKA